MISRRTFAAVAGALSLAGCSDTVGDPQTWPVSEPHEKSGPTPADTPEPGDRDGDHDGDDTLEATSAPAPMPHEAMEFFAGLWRVDQPNHALYEATVYDFRIDGALIEVANATVGHDDFPEVGVVGKCVDSHTETWEDCTSNGICEERSYTACVEWSPICTFGDRWHASDRRTLHISGDCDDDRSREITLTFGDPEVVPNPYAAPIEITVGGEVWEHNWWDWMWTRCREADTCLMN